MLEKNLGEIAYEGHYEARKGFDKDGSLLLPWENLSPFDKECWEASGQKVYRAFLLELTQLDNVVKSLKAI